MFLVGRQGIDYEARIGSVDTLGEAESFFRRFVFFYFPVYYPFWGCLPPSCMRDSGGRAAPTWRAACLCIRGGFGFYSEKYRFYDDDIAFVHALAVITPK